MMIRGRLGHGEALVRELSSFIRRWKGALSFSHVKTQQEGGHPQVGTGNSPQSRHPDPQLQLLAP